MVEPAVVEAVAAPIKIPESGAKTKAGMFIASRRAIISTCSAEALIIPAMVPVPIKRIDTPITLLRPNSVNSTVFFA